jgi:hypothetical protein
MPRNLAMPAVALCLAVGVLAAGPVLAFRSTSDHDHDHDHEHGHRYHYAKGHGNKRPKNHDPVPTPDPAPSPDPQPVPPPAPVNASPVVSAGAPQTVTMPTPATLAGSVSDDGLPNSALTSQWSQVAGPGSVAFTSPQTTATAAAFDAPGTYVLRLTASDGDLTSSSDVTVTVSAAPQAEPPPTDPQPTSPPPAPSTTPAPDTSAPPPSTSGPVAGSNISAVWANEGGDKVTRDELRASNHTENLTGTVVNRAWDGNKIRLSGARNEVISFNLVLEAATATANAVSVSFDTLTGPNGAKIQTTAPASDVFNWVNRPIELFLAQYVQIKGLSYFGYFHGDERQIPVRFQTPWGGAGVGTGKWTDRPDHDKWYPDALVPHELIPTFTINQGSNQSVWADIYLPKTAPAGTYTGTVSIKENGATTRTVPVSLTVQPFALPDTPTAKTMVALSTSDIMWRYVTGMGGYVNWASSDGARVASITDKYFELFHRHKVGLLGENECPVVDRPCDTGIPRVKGSLYTAANGYDGPGVNTPATAYSLGTYGTWPGAWKTNQSLFTQHVDAWSNWFAANAPSTDLFLYLEDEPPSSDFSRINQWSQWMTGKKMLSFSTTSFVTAKTLMPSLAIPAMAAGIGGCPPNQGTCNNTAVTQSAADFYSGTAGRKLWMYNDGRPGVGSSMTEDDGVAFRTMPWAQFKKNVSNWFYWYANPDNATDWFRTATTWGDQTQYDNSIGWTGSNGTSNGNGLLVYPGTNVYGQTSFGSGVDGPIASLRLKEWRRGLQDADYLALAKQIDAGATNSIINAAMPKALWENPAPGGDPSWFNGPISWSSNPDDWEAKRAQLATIITGACTSNPGASYCQ